MHICVFYMARWNWGEINKEHVFFGSNFANITMTRDQMQCRYNKIRKKMGFHKSMTSPVLWCLRMGAQIEQVWDECCGHLAEVAEDVPLEKCTQDQFALSIVGSC